MLSRGKFAFGEVKGRVKVPENTSRDTFDRGDALVRRLAPMGAWVVVAVGVKVVGVWS